MTDRNGNNAMMPPPMPLEDDRPISLREFWFKFLRRRRLFCWVAGPVFLGMVISRFTAPFTPIYRATFDLGVAQEAPVEGFFTNNPLSPTAQIGHVMQRVITNLLSVDLAQRLADSLGLYAYVRGKGSPIQVQARVRQSYSDTLGPYTLSIANNRFRMSGNGESILEGELNQWVMGDYLQIWVSTEPAYGKTETYQITFYPRNVVALALRNSISVHMLEADKIEKDLGVGLPYSGEGSAPRILTINPRVYDTNIGILRVGVHWSDPGVAKSIAEVLTQLIIEEDRVGKSAPYVQSRVFIDSQLVVYRDRLTELEEQVKTFKSAKKIADLKASTQALITQISALESRKSQLAIEQKILDDLAAYLATPESGEAPNFASAMVSDPALQSLYSQLLLVEGEMKGRLKEYSPTHPKVLESRANLDGLKEQMREEITKRRSSIGSEIRSVDTQIIVLQSKLTNVPDDEIQLARLERDKETAEKLYTFFAEKLEETRVQESGVTSDLRVINPPVVTPGPVNTRGLLKGTIMAFFISIGLGLAAVIAVEYLDTTIKDPKAISDHLGVPIFATIPRFESGRKQRSTLLEWIPVDRVVEWLKERKIMPFGKRQRRSERPPVLVSDTTAAEFEAFRKLSVHLDFAHPDRTYKVIYITSPGPEEGKTSVTLNLGYVFCMVGKRVILVDSDFRKKRGHLTDVVRLHKKPGLFEVLKGEKKLKDAIVHKVDVHIVTKYKPSDNGNQANGNGEPSAGDPELHFDLLPQGQVPPNPFVFMESSKMRQLLDELRQNYDYVLIDGLPVLLFADAVYLAKFADGILLTAMYGKTKYRELENARDLLALSQAELIGMIVNNVPRTADTYYHYYYKYYSKYYRKA